MSVIVELWGGPCDGLVMTLPEVAPAIHIPVADFDIRPDDTDDSPPRPTISKVEYQLAGRIRNGRQVYRISRP